MLTRFHWIGKYNNSIYIIAEPVSLQKKLNVVTSLLTTFVVILGENGKPLDAIVVKLRHEDTSGMAPGYVTVDPNDLSNLHPDLRTHIDHAISWALLKV